MVKSGITSGHLKEKKEKSNETVFGRGSSRGWVGVVCLYVLVVPYGSDRRVRCL